MACRRPSHGRRGGTGRVARETGFYSVLLCLLLAAAAPAAESGHPVTMWQLDGAQNRLYLLGSVHLLRAEDHPLPSIIDTAYADAETIVMEVDMDDIDPVAAQQGVKELGMLPEGRSLEELLGSRLYARAARFAEDVDVPLAMLDRTEPWLAAITVEQLMLARIGFNPVYGVEQYLTEMAIADGKPVVGLETVRQQLEFLDGMSPEAQNALLLQSLEASAEIEQMMDDLVRAWRHGDTAYLESQMLEDMQEHPELHREIVVERNRNWIAAIEKFAGQQDDYLIVVGALHLIGEDGVPALLEARGYDVVQMHQP